MFRLRIALSAAHTTGDLKELSKHLQSPVTIIPSKYILSCRIDPYWTPPPGWKLGDNPTQDPVCARELRALREEIAKLKHHACMDLNVPVFTTTPNNNKLHHTTTLLLPLKVNPKLKYYI